MADVPVYLTKKRKRGRPRKDDNFYRDHNLQSPINNPNIGKKLNFFKHNNTFEGIVGNTVYGVIEGSFDAGYLISVKTANSCIPFRGVVFHSEKVIPVTPANDIAPKAKLYQRRGISVPVYNAQSQFSKTPPISPCASNTSAPYVFGNHPAFSIPGATVPRNVSCPNLQGNVTKQGVSRLGINNNSQFAHIIDNGAILEHDELMLGSNMNSMASTRDMLSDSSYKTIINCFTGNGVNSELGSNVLIQNNLHRSNVELSSNLLGSSPRLAAFGNEHNGMTVNQGGWQREIQAIQSNMELNDQYHGQMNNLDLNFHQTIFTNQSQHGVQDQPGTNFHKVDFVNDNSRCQSLNSPLASVMPEHKSLQELDTSEACVETSYLDTNEFNSSNPLWQSLKDENNFTKVETGEKYPCEDATSLPKTDSLFNQEIASTQSEPERRHGKQTACSVVSITGFDYVMSDVVPSSESLSFHSQAGEQVIHEEASGYQVLWKK